MLKELQTVICCAGNFYNVVPGLTARHFLVNKKNLFRLSKFLSSLYPVPVSKNISFPLDYYKFIYYICTESEVGIYYAGGDAHLIDVSFHYQAFCEYGSR